MPAITPFLWFNDNAEEAMNFYVSIFPNSRIVSLMRGAGAGPWKKDAVYGGTIELDGRQIRTLNGGPQYTFTPAISLFVSCKTQQEVDYYWEKLGEGGQYVSCGWLTDKFGVSWQIIPDALMRLLQDPDQGRARRALEAMMGMIKIDIAGLEAAANAG